MCVFVCMGKGLVTYVLIEIILSVKNITISFYLSGFCLFEIRLIFAFVDHILHNRNIKRFKKERYRQSAEILQVIKLEEK